MLAAFFSSFSFDLSLDSLGFFDFCEGYFSSEDLWEFLEDLEWDFDLEAERERERE